MNLSMNSIIGIVCSQINANMQSHMRGYSNSDTKSYPKEKDVNQDEQAFFNFSSDVLRFLYGGFPQRLLEKFFNEDEEKIVSYLRSINEEILSSNDFTKAIIENKAMIRKLCSYEFFISVGIGVSNRIKVNPSISYIPSIDDAASNIIRIGITEEQNELRYGDGIKFLNGTIDIYENGNVVFNSFSKDTLKIQLEDTDKGLVILKDSNGMPIYTKESLEATVADSNIDKDSMVIVSNLIKGLLQKVNYPVDNKITK